MNSFIDYLLHESENANYNNIVISLVGAGGKTSSLFWLASLFKQKGLKVCVTTSTKMYYPTLNEIDHIIYLNDQTIPTSNFRTKETLFCDISDESITFCFDKKSVSEKISDRPEKISGIAVSDIGYLRENAPFDVILVEADGAKRRSIKSPASHEPCLPDNTDVVIGLTGAETINQPINQNQVHRWSHFSQICEIKDGDSVDQDCLLKLITHPMGMFKGAPVLAKKIWQINKVDITDNYELLKKTASYVLDRADLLDEIWLTRLNQGDASIERITREIERTSLTDK